MLRMLAILVSLSFSAQAFAVTAPPPADDGHGGGSDETAENVHVSSYQVPNDVAAAEQAEIDAANPPDDGRYVDMPNLNVPVVQNDRLIGYAYVLVRYHMPDNADEYRIREKIHILLNELVRTSHSTPFVRTGRDSYDSTATHELWLEVSGHIVNPELITDIQIIGSDIRFLRE